MEFPMSAEDFYALQDNSTNRPKKRRLNYTLEFKKEVVEYAIMTNNCRAAEQYRVPRQCVQKWRNCKEDIVAAMEEQGGAKKRRMSGGGRHVKDEELEHALAEWYRENTLENKKITPKSIRQHAQVLSKNLKFKASDGWLQKFMKRNKFTLGTSSRKRQKSEDEDVQNIIDILLKLDNIWGVEGDSQDTPSDGSSANNGFPMCVDMDQEISAEDSTSS